MGTSYVTIGQYQNQEVDISIMCAWTVLYQFITCVELNSCHGKKANIVRSDIMWFHLYTSTLNLKVQNWCSERWCDLLRVTQLVSGLWTQAMTPIKCTRLLWLRLGTGSDSAEISMKILKKVYSLKETELALQDYSLQSSVFIWEGSAPTLTAPKSWWQAGFQRQVL